MLSRFANFKSLFGIGVAAVSVLCSATVRAGGAEPALIEAVRKGDQAAIRTLLATKTNVNDATVDGTTALHWASQRGDVDALERLLGAGADVRASNRYGITPLWLASVNGDARTAERLLKAGADANAPRLASGETPLMIAARSGHAEVVQLLLRHGANAGATETVRGQTALMWAAAEAHPEVVKVLLAAGADFKVQSLTKLTALMFAIRAGDVESTRLLIDAGASANERAADGTSMLVLAIVNTRFKVATLLLDRGADANISDPHGRPLHALTLLRRANNRGLSRVVPRLAAETEMDSLEFAGILVQRGADVNWSDPEGLRLYSTGLYGTGGGHMAIAMPGFSLVRATAFLLAAANCDVPMMKFLAAHGADPSLPTAQSVTPLLAAAGVGFRIGERPGTVEEALEAVKLAYELGNDPAAVIDSTQGTAGRAGAGRAGGNRMDGQTALHGAVVREATGLAAWLIEHGVSLTQRSGDGRTALDLTQVQSLGTTFIAQQQLATLIRAGLQQRGIPEPAPAAASTARPAAP